MNTIKTLNSIQTSKENTHNLLIISQIINLICYKRNFKRT